jgi:hypothetical protein
MRCCLQGERIAIFPDRKLSLEADEPAVCRSQAIASDSGFLALQSLSVSRIVWVDLI